MFEAGNSYRFIAGPALIPSNPDKVKLIKKLDNLGTWKVSYTKSGCYRETLINEWMIKPV